jgi:hypothetical protein
MDALGCLVVACEYEEFLERLLGYQAARPNVTSPQRAAHYQFVKHERVLEMTGPKVC